MDGSAATSLAERTRSHLSRAFVNKSANDANARNELFEQLLNLSFTVQPPPVKEPQPSDRAPTNAGDLSKSGEKKDTAKVDEDKDDEPTVAVASLAQIVQPIADKPIERQHDQTAPEPQAETALNVADSDTNQVTEQLNPTAAAPGAGDPVSAQLDDQLVVSDPQATDSTIVTSVLASDSTQASVAAPIENNRDSSSKKPTVSPAKVDAAQTTQPQEVEVKNDDGPKENVALKSAIDQASEPKTANAPSEDSDDRRDDRREKWYERKVEKGEASVLERPVDHADSQSLEVNSDATKSATNDGSAQPSTLAAPATSVPVDPTVTAPAAIPASLSIVPLNVSAEVTATAKVSSTSGSESTSSINSTPSRPVGSQTAKANSKEKVNEPGLSQQERVRVIQRIARSFNRISSEGGTINLRLHPEHLGSVSVQVRLEGKSFSARLSTETTAARDSILQDLPALRQRLADQGFDVTKFQVDVAGNGADASFAQSNGGSQFGQSENRSNGAQTDYRRVAANRESRAATMRQSLPSTNAISQSGAGIDLQA